MKKQGLLAVGLLAGLVGCGGDAEPLLLASTTSTEDSGLFDVLLPAFEAAHPGVDVRVTAVGTGQALELGRRKDADVLLVHAPPAESAFVAAGHGTIRCEVMYNDFVVAGPPSDPAGIEGLDEAPAALARIAAAGASFISRGDDSGTHRKERALWSAAGLEPWAGDRAETGTAARSAWYMEVGQGMAEALRMAGEERAYALTDRATYLSARPDLDLAVLVEGDPRLFNQYSVIPVAGAAHPGAARDFARWITEPEAQALIDDFGLERFGRPLFVPNAPRPCPVPGP
jgi:tungstate transport system substrate-binding protein